MKRRRLVDVLAVSGVLVLAGCGVRWREDPPQDIARRHVRAGEYREALLILNKLAAEGSARSFEWMDIATCHEKLGDHGAALAAVDNAIGDGSWWPPYEEKARLLAKLRGAGAATEWLEKLYAETAEKRKFASILGNVHRRGGRTKQAVGYYRKAVEHACAEHGFTFGADHMLVLDEATLAKENNDYASLWPTLETLGHCCYGLGQKDAAFQYATMGVSIGQQLKRCKGYYGASEIQAGDCDCRLIRARILMDRGALDRADVEIAHARTLAARSTPRRQRSVTAAAKRLTKLRAQSP